MIKWLRVTILMVLAVILVMPGMEASAKKEEPPTPPTYPHMTATKWYMPFQCAIWDVVGGFEFSNVGSRYVWIDSHDVISGNFYGWAGNLDSSGNVNLQYLLTSNISLTTWAFTAIQRDESEFVNLGYWVYTGTLMSNPTSISGTYSHCTPNHIDTCKFSLTPQ